MRTPDQPPALHHHVVRAFPGGVEGFALLDATAKKKVAFNRAELKKTLRAYLDKSAKEQPFPDNARPLNLQRLKVVAFIQDDASKEVYQAIQVDVPEAKSGPHSPRQAGGYQGTYHDDRHLHTWRPSHERQQVPCPDP